MYDHILVRFGELSTKGHNRSQLEQILQRNIQQAVQPWPTIRVVRKSSRIVVELGNVPVKPVMDRLRRVFGISSLSAVARTELSVQAILDTAVRVYRHEMPTPGSFKVEVRRGNKQFELDSPTLAREVGAAILRDVEGATVDVHHPEVQVEVDVRDADAYVFAGRVQGAGGFPVSMSGRVAGLLSGGIDSPVAVWKALRRGLDVDLVHFHSFPFTSERAQRKVEDLTSLLADWAGPRRLYLVSLTEVQAEIRRECPESLRTVLLRRMMFRIVTAMADRNNWGGIVTGDSVGQVASQTLEALNAVDAVTPLTVIRPLAVEDKVDIIRMAQAIQTYDVSILPYDDCCSLFAPRRPKTHPTLKEVTEGEAALDIEGLVQRAMDTVEVKTIASV
ncbi:tRNA uracil 4-sulfurtransferase ThiI [Alicyclobacillus acidiphilus]|uniref:tRNA uracil 4-sulfurtransferase ThiI n=1 Tax=Alicyclobacillus acidiphilus TaxID=182455 RepID=UPI00082E5C14|nr:tRNA uracil 4-sulfurtransferase ThiI [Alicyclobacillus acidiphilus]